jgi:hypothetical protein
MPQDIKSFLHEWCAKNKIEPQFESRPTGELLLEEKLLASKKNFFPWGRSQIT